jgi:hypothetical protein
LRAALRIPERDVAAATKADCGKLISPDFDCSRMQMPSPHPPVFAKSEELLATSMVKNDTSFIFMKGTTMKPLVKTSQVLLIVAALSVAFAGCERRGADQS